MRSFQSDSRSRLAPLSGIAPATRETPLVNPASMQALDLALTLAALSVDNPGQIEGNR